MMIKQKTIEDCVLDTNKHCWLCWGQLSDPESSSTYSIHQLSRYLKLDGRNIKKVVNGKVMGSKLKAKLCEDCAKLNAKLSELTQQLRKIEMEAIFFLTLIHRKLLKMTPSHFKEGFLLGRTFEMAKGLRMEANEKCSQKISRAHPRIKVWKLSGPQLLSQKLRLKCNPRIRAPKTKPNYEDLSDSESIIITDEFKRETGAAITDGTRANLGVIHLNDLIWSEISKSKKVDREPKTKMGSEFGDHPVSKSGSMQAPEHESRSSACKFCHRSFSKSCNRDRHMKSYCLMRKTEVAQKLRKVQQTKLYEVVQAPISSPNMAGHWKSQVNIHPKSGQHHCKLCPKIYNSSVSFQRHYRVVHRSGVDKFQEAFLTPSASTEPDVKNPSMTDTPTKADSGDDNDNEGGHCANLSPLGEVSEVDDTPHSTDLFSIINELDTVSPPPSSENSQNVGARGGCGAVVVNIKLELPEPVQISSVQVDHPAMVSQAILESVPPASRDNKYEEMKKTYPAQPLKADPDKSKPYKLRRRNARRTQAPSLDSGDDDNDDAGSNYSANPSPNNIDSEDLPEPPSPPISKPSKTKKKSKSAARRSRKTSRNRALEGYPWSTFNPENAKHKCKLCPFESGRIREIRRHYGIVHMNRPERSRNLKCDICGCRFHKRVLLNYHHKRVHLGVPPYGVAGGPFPCPHCKKELMTMETLRHHVQALHENMKSHVCHHCGKGFINNTKLRTHIAGVHLMVKEFVCEVCGKSFHHNANLQRHRGQVHLGKREHICEQCGNSFAQASTLKTHIKLAHSEQYDFGCDLCDKRFKLKMYLQQHRRSAHKGVDGKPRQMDGGSLLDAAKNVPEELVKADLAK